SRQSRTRSSRRRACGSGRCRWPRPGTAGSSSPQKQEKGRIPARESGLLFFAANPQAHGHYRTTPRATADALLLAVHWSRADDVLAQAGDLSGKVVVTYTLPMNEETRSHRHPHVVWRGGARAKKSGRADRRRFERF